MARVTPTWLNLPTYPLPQALSALQAKKQGAMPMICPLPYQLIHLEARDLMAFLAGQFACDTRLASAEQACFGCYCGRDGRVLANFLLYKDAEQPDHAWLLMEASLIPETLKTLHHYGQFSALRTTIEKDWLCVGSILPEQPPATPVLGLTQTTTAHTIDYYGPGLRQWHVMPRTHLTDWLSQRASSQCVDPAVWDYCDGQQGLAQLTDATQKTFLPQALHYAHFNAFCLNKGCYLGQEIIARTSHRGRIKEGLCRIATTQPSASSMQPGALLQDTDEKKCGQVIYSYPNADGHNEALAVLRMNAGAVMTCPSLSTTQKLTLLQRF